MLGLQAALSIAAGSISVLNDQIGTVSNNVANASTPGYVEETVSPESTVAGSDPTGVRAEPAMRQINAALQRAAFQQDTTVANLTTTTNALKTIDGVLGTPGSGNDLGSLVTNVQNAFTALLTDPSSAAGQQAVVRTAGSLASGINTLASAATTQRQAAQDDLSTTVTAANANLVLIGTLSDQIIAARVGGQSTAGLENERDAAVQALGQLIPIKILAQPGGDLVVTTLSGAQLPIRAGSGPLSIAPATVGPGAAYPGTLPGIMLNGADITSRIQGGQMGADIALRDQTLPRFQGELDEFAYQLASRFSAQGLDLFTTPSGTVPAGGGVPVQSTYIGFSSEISVNPAVAATPSLVRDGTHAVAGSPTGASAFTPNPPGGPAGFTSMIARVLSFALGTSAQAGVAQPASAVSGLGVNGDLTAPYAAPAALADNAVAVVSAQSAVSATATARLSTEQAVQTTLNANFSAASGVNLDAEMAHMIQLENAYGVSAKIISAVQTMFNQLSQAVP